MRLTLLDRIHFRSAVSREHPRIHFYDIDKQDQKLVHTIDLKQYRDYTKRPEWYWAAPQEEGLPNTALVAVSENGKIVEHHRLIGDTLSVIDGTKPVWCIPVESKNLEKDMKTAMESFRKKLDPKSVFGKRKTSTSKYIVNTNDDNCLYTVTNCPSATKWTHAALVFGEKTVWYGGNVLKA